MKAPWMGKLMPAAILALALPMLTGCIGGMAFRSVSSGIDIASNEKDAANGNVQAQFALGEAECCVVGAIDPVHDNVKAAHWLCRAARQDYPPAQYRLGRIYSGAPITGFDPEQRAQVAVLGFPKNLPVAAVWLVRAAHNGNPDASKELAVLWPKLSATDQARAGTWLADWQHAPCEWTEVIKHS